MFDDVLSANLQYQLRFHDAGIAGIASKHLAVLTCIDSRIDPLAMLGLRAGDAKIIRNAGARATDDALRSLVLAVAFLQVDRICVVQHTDCAMAGRTNEEIAAVLETQLGVSTDRDFLTMSDQPATLRADVELIRRHELLPRNITVGGFMFDVSTGAVSLLA